MMRRVTTRYFTTFAAVSLLLASCAQRPEPHGTRLRPQTAAIVNGTPISRNSQHPGATSLVGLTFTKHSDPFCGGTLIGPDLVVTAAHCLEPNPGEVFAYFAGPKISRPKRIRAKAFAVHPAYLAAAARGILSEPGYDVAWMRLEEPAPSGFKPIRILPRGTNIAAGTRLEVAGYGYLTTGRPANDGVPRATQVTFQEFRNTPHRRNAIRVDEAGSGTCYGDSGGPLYVQLRGEWFVAGAVSDGTHPLDTCGEWGAWFSDLSAYTDWIAASSQSAEPSSAALAQRFPHADWGDRSLPEGSLGDLCARDDLEPFAWGLVHSILKSVGARDCTVATEAAQQAPSLLQDDWLQVRIPLNDAASGALPRDAVLRVLADVGSLRALEIQTPESYRVELGPLLDRFPELRRLRLTGTPGATPERADWEALERFGKITDLNLTTISSPDLRRIAKLKSLTSLTLYGDGLSDISALSALGKFGTLESIDLSGNAITDLSPLRAITSLKSIRIQDNARSLRGTRCPVRGARCEF